jgi:hypothetical protein
MSACVIADVSGSTGEARVAYAKSFSTLAKRIGTDGSGKVCVVLTAGDPQAEGVPVKVNVGPNAPTAGKKGEVQNRALKILFAVREARRKFETVLSEPAVGQPGSALLEAAVVAARELKPGDELLYLSDGIQNSPTIGNFLTANLSRSARESLLDRLERAKLIPNLEGIPIGFPYLLYHPNRGGLERAGANQEREVDIRTFWEEWATRAKTHVSFTTR